MPAAQGPHNVRLDWLLFARLGRKETAISVSHYVTTGRVPGFRAVPTVVVHVPLYFCDFLLSFPSCFAEDHEMGGGWCGGFYYYPEFWNSLMLITDEKRVNKLEPLRHKQQLVRTSIAVQIHMWSLLLFCSTYICSTGAAAGELGKSKTRRRQLSLTQHPSSCKEIDLRFIKR